MRLKELTELEARSFAAWCGPSCIRIFPRE